MGWMELVSSVISSLAWPACILLIVWFLRRGLVNMLISGPIKLLKAGPSGLELEYFDQKLTDASVNAGLSTTKPSSDSSRSRGRKSEKKEGVENSTEQTPDELELETWEAEYILNAVGLLRSSPAAAVTEAFMRLEETLRMKLEVTQERDLKGDEGGQQPSPLTVQQLPYYAIRKGIFSVREAMSFLDLLKLRDAILYEDAESVVNRARAETYIKVAARLMATIYAAPVEKSD